MKKALIILLAVLGLLLLVAIIAAVIVDNKYEAIWSASRISHESVAPPQTALRAVVNPRIAKNYLITDIAQATGMKAAGIARVLPHELAVLVSTDLATRDAGVTLFINEQRLGPVICEEAKKASALSQNVPFVQWNPEGLAKQRRGKLVANGFLTLRPDYVDVVNQEWGSVQTPSPLTINGGHFIEAVIDNRDGGAFALIGTLIAMQAGGNRGFEPAAIGQSLWTVGAIRITADMIPDYLTPDDPADEQMNVRIVIDCNPLAEQADVDTLAFVLTTLIAQAKGMIQSETGMILDGAIGREGLQITLDYKLTRVNQYVLKQVGPLLGAPAA